MLEAIIIVVCAAVCIGAAAYAWWMENGPEKDAVMQPERTAKAMLIPNTTAISRMILSFTKHTNNDNIYQH